jgi:hypothetical protein
MAVGAALPLLMKRISGTIYAIYALIWLAGSALSVTWLYKFDKWNFETLLIGIITIYAAALVLLASPPIVDKLAKSAGK